MGFLFGFERNRRQDLLGRFPGQGLLALALLGTACLAACSAPASAPQTAKSEAVPVRVATVMRKTVPVDLRAIGNVEAYSTVRVKSQVEGIIERVHFAEGQDVKAGDLLFSIDPRPFAAVLQEAEARLARDLALEKNAKAQAERYTKLYQAGIVSQDQFDQFQTNAESYAAAVRADRAAVERARLELGYCQIRSPLEGRTGQLMLHQGNLVKANADTPMVVVNEITPIYVSFSVPEQDLPAIKKYQRAGRLRVEVTVPGANEPPAQGLLTFIDNAVDKTTGTVRLKATFENRARRLWPGQFVDVVLKLTTRPDALVVPSQSVQAGQEGQYVFVVKDDLTVESRPVVIGPDLQGETVVNEGLHADERVVTDGQLRLAPGVKVRILEGRANGAGKPA